MDGHQLPLDVGSQLGDFQTAGMDKPFKLVAISFTFGCFLQVDATGIVSRDLNTCEAQALGPLADGFKIIEGGLITQKLC